MINPKTAPRFITIKDLVKGMIRRERDFLATNQLLYESVAKDVYKELNLASIRIPQQYFIRVDKKTNSITLPSNYLEFNSISVINRFGKKVPLIINTNLRSDIVDVSMSKECGCECGCNNPTCSSIKGYEIIQEEVPVVLPNGDTQIFTATLRERLEKDGSLVREKIWPTQKFDGSTYVAVVMETTTETLCHLEVKECGCVSHTKDNDDAIDICTSSATSFGVDGCYYDPGYLMYPDHKHDEYNFSEEGDRITFSSHFKYDWVLLRYFCDVKTKDILVPIIARKCMIAGIYADIADFEKKWPLWRVQKWQADYTKEQTKLRDKLNEINLKKFYSSTFGHRRMV